MSDAFYYPKIGDREKPCVKLDAVRANVVLKVLPVAEEPFKIEGVAPLLANAKKIMENGKPLSIVHLIQA